MIKILTNRDLYILEKEINAVIEENYEYNLKDVKINLHNIKKYDTDGNIINIAVKYVALIVFQNK